MQIEPLVQRAKDDKEAFCRLYELFQPKIYRYVARRVPNISDAEDITAQVFEKVLAGIRGFDSGRASFQAWIYRIAHNSVIDYYRKKGDRCFENIDEARVLYRSESGSDYEYTRKYLQVLGLLKDLAPSYQQILGLRLIEDMRNDEIARLLGYSEKYVAVKISRALKSLRKLAVKRGILDELV